MNNKLRIQLWNDQTDRLSAWESTIRAEGFLDFRSSSSLEAHAVIEQFESFAPDVVILDIVEQKREQPLGIEIARKIRERDLLVPIIAVSQAPDEVYKTKGDLLEYGFTTVLHEKVMAREIFTDVCLRMSLNRWHSAAIDHVLIRKAVNAMRANLNGSGQAFVKSVMHLLVKLAFLGSRERWHSFLCKQLPPIIKKQGYPKIAEQFGKISSAFEAGDPFYMAGSAARHHLSHNVQVFLLGIVWLLEYLPLRTAVLDDIEKQKPGVLPEDALVDALIVWMGIGLTHDAAYISEKFAEVVQKLIGSVNRFAPVLTVPSLEWDVKWPNEHHAVVGAKAWRELADESWEGKLCEYIACGIERHDSSRSDRFAAVALEQWAPFLAVLCDELQDWGRVRASLPVGNKPWNEATWESFNLIQFIFEPDQHHPNNYNVTLQFSVKDFPQTIKDWAGTDSVDAVRERLEKTLGVLKRNLETPFKLEIALCVDFWTRNVPEAICSEQIKRRSS